MANGRNRSGYRFLVLTKAFGQGMNVHSGRGARLSEAGSAIRQSACKQYEKSMVALTGGPKEGKQ